MVSFLEAKLVEGFSSGGCWSMDGPWAKSACNMFWLSALALENTRPGKPILGVYDTHSPTYSTYRATSSVRISSSMFRQFVQTALSEGSMHCPKSSVQTFFAPYWHNEKFIKMLAWLSLLGIAIRGSCSWHTADFEINARKLKQSAELLPVEAQHSQLHLAASCLIFMRSPSLNFVFLSVFCIQYTVNGIHDLLHYIILQYMFLD